MAMFETRAALAAVPPVSALVPLPPGIQPLRSRCRMFLYRPRRQSIGHARMLLSTSSGSGVENCGLKISGLKKTSGPRNRS